MLRPLDAIEEPALLRLLEWWRSHRKDGDLPARGDLNPADLRDILPQLFLVERCEANEEFRYRLMGTALDARLGTHATGRFLSELPLDPGEKQRAAAQYVAALARREPIYCEDALQTGQRALHYRRIVAPLANGRAGHELLVGATVFVRCVWL